MHLFLLFFLQLQLEVLRKSETKKFPPLAAVVENVVHEQPDLSFLQLRLYSDCLLQNLEQKRIEFLSNLVSEHAWRILKNEFQAIQGWLW